MRHNWGGRKVASRRSWDMDGRPCSEAQHPQICLARTATGPCHMVHGAGDGRCIVLHDDVGRAVVPVVVVAVVAADRAMSNMQPRDKVDDEPALLYSVCSLTACLTGSLCLSHRLTHSLTHSPACSSALAAVTSTLAVHHGGA